MELLLTRGGVATAESELCRSAGVRRHLPPECSWSLQELLGAEDSSLT